MLLPVRALVLAVSAALAVAAGSSAQTYGLGSPGFGGATPRLVGDQAWMGNLNHQLRLDNARDNSLAFLAVSKAPASTILLGAPIHIDLGQAFYIVAAVTGGTPGVPGSGSAAWPIPIQGPVDPTLAGISFYSQALVNDYVGTTPAVTNGWITTLAMRPCVFVGTSVGGSTDPYWFVDAPTLTLKDSGGRVETDNVTSAVFTDGGTDFYVGSSIQSTIYHADMSGPTPLWSTLIPFAGSGAYNLRHDAARKRLWCMTDAFGGGRELTAVDVDKSSATYGQVVGMTTGVGSLGLVERFGLSPDGNEAAIQQVLGSSLWIYDLDPASGTFGQLTATLTIPTSLSGPFTLTNQVAYTADGLEIHCLIQHTGSTDGEVARYSRATGVWIDHDLTTPAVVDNIGPMSSPAISMGSAPTSYDMSKWDDFAIAAGFGGSGWAGRLDWDPNDWTSFSWTPVNGVPTGTWAAAMDFGEGTIGVAKLSPAELQLYDMTSMNLLGAVALTGGSSNIYTVVWR